MVSLFSLKGHCFSMVPFAQPVRGTTSVKIVVPSEGQGKQGSSAVSYFCNIQVRLVETQWVYRPKSEARGQTLSSSLAGRRDRGRTDREQPGVTDHVSSIATGLKGEQQLCRWSPTGTGLASCWSSMMKVWGVTWGKAWSVRPADGHGPGSVVACEGGAGSDPHLAIHWVAAVQLGGSS